MIIDFTRKTTRSIPIIRTLPPKFLIKKLRVYCTK